MEKTVQIVIASTTFTCTEGAYTKLSSYLARMEEHFDHESERSEIMRDIESRIAEKLLEKKKPLISVPDVEEIIAEMGEVSELEDDAPEAPLAATGKVRRRLYRDTEDVMIAGVASGIAAYFDANPLLVRLIFLITIFFGGTGIIVYILLWVIVPEARTTAQKLEMRGEPVTFDTIRASVKTRAEDGKGSNIARRIPHFTHAFIVKALGFGAKVFGLFVILGAAFGIIGLSIFLGVILTNWNAPFNDIPVREASSSALFMTTAVAGYFAALIPLILISAFGYRLLRARTLISGSIGLGLLGIWALAVVAVGVCGFKIAGDYYYYTETNPEYAVSTRSVELADFSHIVVEGVHVRIAEGSAPEATLEGRANGLDRVVFTEENGVLTVEKTEREESCFFCDTDHTSITIHAPALDSVEVRNGVASFDAYETGTLAVTVEDGSMYGSITADQLLLNTRHAHISADVTAQMLTIGGVSSSFYLNGSAASSTISLLQDTSFRADSLIIENAALEAIDSYAELTVRGNFTKNVDRDSEVYVEGQEDAEMPEGIVR